MRTDNGHASPVVLAGQPARSVRAKGTEKSKTSHSVIISIFRWVDLCVAKKYLVISDLINELFHRHMKNKENVFR